MALTLGPRESPATPQVFSAAPPLTRKDRQRPTGPDHPGMAPSRPGLDLGLWVAVDTRRSTCQSSPGQVTPSKSVLVYLGTWTPSAVRQGWGLGPCGRSLSPTGALRVDSCACVSDPPADTLDTRLGRVYPGGLDCTACIHAGERCGLHDSTRRWEAPGAPLEPHWTPPQELLPTPAISQTLSRHSAEFCESFSDSWTPKPVMAPPNQVSELGVVPGTLDGGWCQNWDPQTLWLLSCPEPHLRSHPRASLGVYPALSWPPACPLGLSRVGQRAAALASASFLWQATAPPYLLPHICLPADHWSSHYVDSTLGQGLVASASLVPGAGC